jgi:hypothetical protein
MARRKTGDFHMRVDPENRAAWDACARQQGISLAMWFECLANREVLALRRAPSPEEDVTAPLPHGRGRLGSF